LTLQEKERVFIKYFLNTNKHFKIYIPDLGRVIFGSRIEVDESVSESTVKFQLQGL